MFNLNYPIIQVAYYKLILIRKCLRNLLSRNLLVRCFYNLLAVLCTFRNQVASIFFSMRVRGIVYI